MVLIIVLLIVGLIARAVLAAGRTTRQPDGADTVDRSPAPPAHPQQPLPGSATRRHEQGKP
ncbi:MAG TPA: hypothetical protein VIR58_05385 [Acidimicrobiales bacterium]